MTERDDQAAARFEADPELKAAIGERVRKKRGALSAHVPVRFDQATIAAVKRIADLDRVTVSTWIRTVVEREIRRRVPDAQTAGNQRGGVIMGGSYPTTGLALVDVTCQPLVASGA